METDIGSFIASLQSALEQSVRFIQRHRSTLREMWAGDFLQSLRALVHRLTSWRHRAALTTHCLGCCLLRVFGDRFLVPRPLVQKILQQFCSAQKVLQSETLCFSHGPIRRYLLTLQWSQASKSQGPANPDKFSIQSETQTKDFRPSSW